MNVNPLDWIDSLNEDIMHVTFELKDWLEKYMQDDTITDIGRAFGVCPSGPWLAGGAVRRCLFGIEQTSDYDFFFANEEQRNKFIEVCKELGLVNTSETKNAVTFKGYINGAERVVQAVTIQLDGTLKETLDRFDFTLTQFEFDGVLIHTKTNSIRDASSMKLVVNKITYPEASLRRIIKYSKQGYHMCGGAMRVFLTESAKALESNPPIIEYVD